MSNEEGTKNFSTQIDCVSRKRGAWGSIIFTEDKFDWSFVAQHEH